MLARPPPGGLTAVAGIERSPDLGRIRTGARMQQVAQQTTQRAGGLSVRCQGLVHLYKTFEGHDVVALQGVDLNVAAGERLAFLGPSGSGKSTLLTLLGGIQRPSAGRIFLGDEEISRLSERQLTRVRASRVSTMLQGATRNLLHYATARQNLRFN